MFNEFFLKCYEDAKRKGFHDNPPTSRQIDASVKFLNIICEAAKEFELERKNKAPCEDSVTNYPCDSEIYKAIVKTALLASEITEAAEWALNGDIEDQTDYNKILNSNGLYETVINSKPEGYASELADIIIRLGDQCGMHGIDMDYEIERKMEYNRTREYMNGKMF
jgi:NTP pyrophosphatase (non-canonical NTP hydrolase)